MSCNIHPEYWSEILGPRIKRIHVKDFKQSVGNIRGFTNLLEGDVNWGRVIGALKKAGYDGYVTAELSPYHYCPDQIASDVATRLRRIIA